MHRPPQSLIGIAVLLFSVCGCDRSNSVSPVTLAQAPPSERQQILAAVAEAEREAANTEPPKPNIALVTPPGWTRSQPSALPPEDHGFTVAYEHESGLAVTLYQFTRGLTIIPDEVSSTALKEELRYAKDGIEQAVQLGYWQAAKENESKTVQLGDSQQQALWSQYQLTADDMIVASEIYVWARKNTLFKLRCTSRSEDVTSNQEILRPLLTAFGSSDLDATGNAK